MAYFGEDMAQSIVVRKNPNVKCQRCGEEIYPRVTTMYDTRQCGCPSNFAPSVGSQNVKPESDIGLSLQQAVDSGRPFLSKSWKSRNGEEPWVARDLLSKKFKFINGEQGLWHPEYQDFKRNDFALKPFDHLEIIEMMIECHPGNVERIKEIQEFAKIWVENYFQPPF